MRWESIWYPDSAVGQILSAALAPLGWLYAAGWRVYLATYALGVKQRTRVPIPVFCVGNLEVGGSGKTPLAIALADLLEEMDLRPAMSVSGYGSPASVGARSFQSLGCSRISSSMRDIAGSISGRHSADATPGQWH